MALEPQVIRSISRSRSRKRAHLLLVSLPLIIALFSVVFLVVYCTATRGIATRESTSISLPAIVSVPVIISIVVFILFIESLLVTPAARQFKSVTRQTIEVDMQRFGRFRNALDSVSIGAGIPAPKLMILKMPTANAFTFWRRGPVVGITKELVEANLSGGEVEAIMAHEVSHIVGRSTLKSPRLVTGIFEFSMICILAALAIIFYYTGGTPSDRFIVWATIVVFGLVLVDVPVSLYLIMRPYSISKLNPGLHHEDILADSIAAKLTNNPESLESAIKKISGLMRDAEAVPSETICFTQLFVGPLAEWRLDTKTHVREWMEIVGVFLRMFVQRYVRDKDECLATMRRQMEGFLKWERRLLEKRLRNLELIKGGEWPTFETGA